MRLKVIFLWLFIYLPKRFSVTLLALLSWFLFYVWPWALNLFFPSPDTPEPAWRKSFVQRVVPYWIKPLNLEPAAKALGILLILGLGVLLMYNVAAFFYRRTRKWSNGPLFLLVLGLTLVIYAYPWLFSPTHWDLQAISKRPFDYLLTGRPVLSWEQGKNPYGVLLLLPLPVLVVVLVAWAWSGWRQRRQDQVCEPMPGITFSAVESETFERSLRENRAKGQELRIGLILAGGGTKGVYQARAMRAIYEFLKHYY